MKLCVIAAAYYSDDSPCELLKESCELLKIPLHLYGLGQPFASLREAKVVQLKRELGKLDTEYVLVTDASDTFLVAKGDEILEKFARRSCRIMVSAEKNCYPVTLDEMHNPKYISTMPWKYLNSGGYIGKREDVIDLLQVLLEIKSDRRMFRSRDRDNDQYLLSIAYLLSLYPISLDRFCDVFQTLWPGIGKEFGWDQNGRLVNTITSSRPCVLHFNGNAPGLREAYGQSKQLFDYSKP